MCSIPRSSCRTVGARARAAPSGVVSALASATGPVVRFNRRVVGGPARPASAWRSCATVESTRKAPPRKATRDRRTHKRPPNGTPLPCRNNLDGRGSMSCRPPDFFLIGAPKAGTSALHAALAAHPHLFLSQVKGADVLHLRRLAAAGARRGGGGRTACSSAAGPPPPRRRGRGSARAARSAPGCCARTRPLYAYREGDSSASRGSCARRGR